jgi:hypothetical protein
VTYDRQVIAYKNYFLDFYEGLPDNVQAKIEWTLNLIRVTRQVPEKYFKHLEGTKGLYEIRVKLLVLFTAFSPFSTKEIWWFLETPFKRRLKRHQNKN